jgi:CBS domain-containing protein
LYFESTRAEQLGLLPGEERPVREVMNRRLVTIDPGARFQDAVELMHRERVAFLIVQDACRMHGLLTERDVAAQAVKEDAVRATTAQEALSLPEPVMCSENDLVADALAVLKRHGVSAVPVLDCQGAVLGVLSLIDATASLMPQTAAAWLAEVRR